MQIRISASVGSLLKKSAKKNNRSASKEADRIIASVLIAEAKSK